MASIGHDLKIKRVRVKLMIGQETADERSEDPIKEATTTALSRILSPLLELMFDAGMTVQELNKIVRDKAVRVASRRVANECGRLSKARVAIMTGLPRSEVARILDSSEATPQLKSKQTPAKRVLAAWFDSPYFAMPNGEPAILPIFGKRRSFEHLVYKYGVGMPVRAMLDELTQMGAVERLAGQRLRAKSRVPILIGLTKTSIAAVGERGKDLLETLTNNMRSAAQPYFEATAVIDESDLGRISLVRREIAEQGANFINGATSLLNRSPRGRRAKTLDLDQKFRLGVTIYYFQEKISGSTENTMLSNGGRRKNLRRQRKQGSIESS